MIERTTGFYSLLMFLFLLATPLMTFAEGGDYVKTIHVCDSDVLIEMQKEGMLVVRESDVGEATVETILERAFALFEAGEPVTYFDPGDPVDICGFKNVRPITNFE